MATACWPLHLAPFPCRYEYYEDESNIYLILEFCDGGELFDRLHMQAGSRYTEAEAARLLFKMVAAICYVHFMGVSHRDLKVRFQTLFLQCNFWVNCPSDPFSRLLR